MIIKSQSNLIFGDVVARLNQAFSNHNSQVFISELLLWIKSMVKFKLIISLIIFFLSNQSLFCQNLDLDLSHHAGEYRAMAGSGIGAVTGVAAFDFNPAGLAKNSHRCCSASQSLIFYSYYLYRSNEGVGAINFDWNKARYNFENLLLTMPIKKNFTVGVGYFQKSNIFLNNKKRAITWSSLFNQDTDGRIHTLSFSSGYVINSNWSFGVTFYQYAGKISSKITGENHGTDADKWASLESSLKGLNYRIGIMYRLKKFSTGIIVESPAKLDVHLSKKLSQDRLYEYLFPNYSRTKWELPLIVGIGFSYAGLKNILLTFDVESHQYRTSNMNFNLFEFGGQPNWKDATIYRFGIELYPSQKMNLPFRLGYASVPQLYASNNSIGVENTILEYENTSQNTKHLLTLGTTVTYSKFSFNFTFEYTKLSWRRNLATRMLVEDKYSESNYIFSTDVIYSF